MRREPSAILVALIVAACHMGPQVSEFPAARGPQGAPVSLRLRSSLATGAFERLEGELLEVRADGLLLRALPAVGRHRDTSRASVPPPPSGRIMLVPFVLIREVRFPGLGSPYDLGDGRMPTSAVRDGLRLVSRFPQGLEPEVLGRLLDIHGQDEILMLGP